MAARTKDCMINSVSDIIDLLNQVTDDLILHRKFTFDFYHYLVDENVSKTLIEEFNSCHYITIIQSQIEEFESFLTGGDSFIREAYPGYSKPEVRRMKEYLEGIITAGLEYEKLKNTRKKRTRKNSSK